MQSDKKALVLAKEMLRQRLEMALGTSIVEGVDEVLIDALFQLFITAPRHTTADVISKHGSCVTLLMSYPYARNKQN